MVIRGWLGIVLLTLMFSCAKTQPLDDSSEPSNAVSPTSDPTSDTKTATSRPVVAFVTNQIASFWNIAKVGCEDAGNELDVEVRVIMPAEATVVEQKRLVEDLITSGVQAIAISPIDAANQLEQLNAWAEKVPLITQDSDAPGSKRLLYIGMDNYLAGRMCGDLVKRALPEGGEVGIFIGRMEQDNSKRRRQGVIDALLDRSVDPTRYDATDGEIKGDKYTIVGTITDQGKEDVAKRKAEDAITAYPGMDAMVGLFAYNPPQILQALMSQGKAGKIKVVGFDEDETTLQGIRDGLIEGTVVQNPYEYGFRSVDAMRKILAGDRSFIPSSQFVDIPARAITRDNLDAFWEDQRAKRGE